MDLNSLKINSQIVSTNNTNVIEKNNDVDSPIKQSTSNNNNNNIDNNFLPSYCSYKDKNDCENNKSHIFEENKSLSNNLSQSTDNTKNFISQLSIKLNDQTINDQLNKSTLINDFLSN